VRFVPGKLVIAKIEGCGRRNRVGQKSGFAFQGAEDHQGKRVKDHHREAREEQVADGVQCLWIGVRHVGLSFAFSRPGAKDSQ
jgi:hypothetical protein